MKRLRKFVIYAFLTAALISFRTLSVLAQENGSGQEISLNAQSAVLMDGETGRILYEKNGDTVRPMASTTKIMTCILALEYGNSDDVVTVSSYAAGQPKVHLGAAAGRRFYLRDLLYSLMLESHNDTAVMIAEHIGGTADMFAKLMNEKAVELGCENTYFITPNGLDASVTLEDGTEKLHSTTAAELAAIMRYCVWESPKSREFLEITRTQNHYFTDIDGKGSYSCVNHNALFSSMEHLLSGKTGFTGGAGYSYVAALEDEGRKYVIALLGCGWPPHKTWKWSDARKLLNYGTSHYELKEIFQQPELKPLAVENGIARSGDLAETAVTNITLNLKEEEKNLNVLMKEGEKAEARVILPDTLKAPVAAGTEVGRVDYFLEGMRVQSYPVYAEETVEELTPRWCLEQILQRYLE